MLHKILVLFCISCLLLTIAGPAAAKTSLKVLDVPAVSADSTTALGTIVLKEDYAKSIDEGDWVAISLPSFVEIKQLSVWFPGGTSSSYWPSVADATYDIDYTKYDLGDEISDEILSDSSGISLWKEGENTFSLKVNKIDDTNRKKLTSTFRCYINFDSVKIKALPPEESGKIEVTLDAPSGSGFSSDKETVANVLTGKSMATSETPKTITDTGGSIANITIKENVFSALEKNDDFKKQDTVKLVLAPGFTWQTVKLLPGWGWQPNDIGYEIGEDTSGRSVLYLQIKNETTNDTEEGRLIISGTVTVDETIARPGKVEVSYEGTNPGVEPAVLTVAEYSVPGASVSGKTTTDVIAGHTNQRLGEFTISEGMAGDLAEGRTITLTLPEGAKWNSYPTVRREAGDGELQGPVPLGDDGRKIKFTVSRAGSEKTVFRFKYATVDLALDAPAQVEVTVSGSAGTKGTVTVARVQTPVTVNTENAKVHLGMQGQPGGEITITENTPGAIRAMDAGGAATAIKLELPRGVTFDQKPVVEVASGDLILKKSGITLEQGNRTLVIPIDISSVTPVDKPTEESTEQADDSAGNEQEKSDSSTQEKVTGNSTETQGSTIKISDILLTLNRTVPEGTLDLEVSGSALNETENLFSDALNKLEIPFALCDTPAPTRVKTTATFNIGSKIYKIGDAEQEMDVAPYIKDGRTYGPIRYIAYALGLSDDDIKYDAASRTVTLFRDERVAQLKVGKPGVFIQGVEIATDVAPEIVDPGRVMLPYRWVAVALGAHVTWQPEIQQVIIN